MQDMDVYGCYLQIKADALDTVRQAMEAADLSASNCDTLFEQVLKIRKEGNFERLSDRLAILKVEGPKAFGHIGIAGPETPLGSDQQRDNLIWLSAMRRRAHAEKRVVLAMHEIAEIEIERAAIAHVRLNSGVPLQIPYLYLRIRGAVKAATEIVEKMDMECLARATEVTYEDAIAVGTVPATVH